MRLLPFDYAVRNLGRSRTRLLLSVIGSTLVVALVLSAGGFVRGMTRNLTNAGSERNVILLGAGSEESVERSEIGMAVPGLVGASVRGIRQRLGERYISPEVHLQTTVLPDEESTLSPQVLVRGVTPAAFLVHHQVRVSEGRVPAAGSDEILVGPLVAQKLGLPAERLAIGQTLFFYDRVWTIVGRLEAPRTIVQSEIWANLSDVQIASKRDNLSCVILTLAEGAAFDDVDLFARQRLDLELIAMRESDYYNKLAAFFRPIRAMVWATALLIASGGILGGLNTMYAAFASRVREVGVLQSMGYSRRAIILSLVEESVLACIAGTLLAAAACLLLLDGINVQFSAGVFGLLIDPTVLLFGLAAGLALGLIGALPPAIQCLNLPITEALKA